VFDFVLAGQYPNEDDIALTQQGKTMAPVGTPRPLAQAPLPGQPASAAAAAAAPASGASR
jgi:penicillin-binding protein 2